MEGKIFLIIPYFDFGIVGTTDKVRLCRMYNNSSNEVIMRLKRFNLLSGVIIEHTDLKVIRSTEDPMFLT